MWDLIVSIPDHCLSFYFKDAPLMSHVMKNLFLPYANSKDGDQTAWMRLCYSLPR